MHKGVYKMIELARALLQEGIQSVPVTGKKVPLVKFEDKDVTGKFIDHHERIYKRTKALGILCRGVWCIDIDVGEKNGIQSIKENMYFSEIDENSQRTLVQRTPSGGLHLVFRKREGIEYRQKINYLDGVDIKAHPNNIFLVSGSQTPKGTYEHVSGTARLYQGDFEERIFGSRGSFEQQILEKYSIENVLPDYDFSHIPDGKGGEGKSAYQRIIDGTSFYRNDDLFKAVSYAIQCNIDVEPLKVLIGDVKDGDEFTEAEWLGTYESAKQNNVYGGLTI